MNMNNLDGQGECGRSDTAFPNFIACGIADAGDPTQLFQVKPTFDSVLSDDDGTCGNNVLIQRMHVSLRRPSLQSYQWVHASLIWGVVQGWMRRHLHNAVIG